MAIDQALPTNPAQLDDSIGRGPFAFFKATGRFFKRNLTKKSGAALAIWRVEARLATPFALVLVATLGAGTARHGGGMAAYAAASSSSSTANR
jgi:hypothetical protein